MTASVSRSTGCMTVSVSRSTGCMTASVGRSTGCMTASVSRSTGYMTASVSRSTGHPPTDLKKNQKAEIVLQFAQVSVFKFKKKVCTSYIAIYIIQYRNYMIINTT